MGERQVIERTPNLPATVESLTRDLCALGVRPGAVVLVHASLRALGWVCGGPVAVIGALEAVVGPSGTLVMPAHSGQLTDPRDWRLPPVPEAWKPLIRAAMPAYDPRSTPTRGVGVIAEAFRAWPGTVRSVHPHVSFAAHGPEARAVCGGHALEFGLGERSPVARIYDLDGLVLLLGVGFASNTSLHLAEYRADYPGKRTIAQGAPVLRDGRREWVTFSDLAISSDDFEELGVAFGSVPGRVTTGRVGAGAAMLMRQRDLVDFGVRWMEAHRGTPRTGDGITVRAAQAADRAEWADLRQALWPGTTAAELGAELDALLVDPRAATFVAAASPGRLRGFAEVALRDEAEGCATHPVGYLEGWYVSPEFRGRGVGRRLAAAGEAWARERGCTEMASDTTPEYPDSPAAHAAAGYERVQVTVHFRKDLVPQQKSHGKLPANED